MLTKKEPKFRKIISIITIIFVSALVITGAAIGTYNYLQTQHQNQERQQAIQQEENTRLAQEAILAAKEAKKKEPVYINLPGAKAVRAIVEDYHLNNSLWALASKTHPLSIDYLPSPLQIPTVSTRIDKSNDERSIRADIVAQTEAMFVAASGNGLNLMLASGYRSAALQGIYFNSLASSIGEAAANQSIAMPGQSEHQTGLAMDINNVAYECYLDNCFADMADGQWLVDNSYKYGFILRYPEGKEDITGYNYESWHFRYLGVDLATAIYESKLTFDEVWPYLEIARNTLIENGAILP